MQVDFQEGKRVAPAFSLVTIENLDKADTWQDISRELRASGLDDKSVGSNQDFIRSWIGQVILSDVDEETGNDNTLVCLVL